MYKTCVTVLCPKETAILVHSGMDLLSSMRSVILYTCIPTNLCETKSGTTSIWILPSMFSVILYTCIPTNLCETKSGTTSVWIFAPLYIVMKRWMCSCIRWMRSCTRWICCYVFDVFLYALDVFLSYFIIREKILQKHALNHPWLCYGIPMA